MDSLHILAMAAAAVQQSESLEALPGRDIHIRHPRPEDLPLLEYVEKSAAQLFRTVKLDSLADGPTVDPNLLNSLAGNNHLWIAANGFDEPIGFVGGEFLEGNFHIVEISVAREYQGNGVGKALMMTILEQAWREGYKAVTLTTYRDLPWNAPWYSKMGFVQVDVENMGKTYKDILDAEAQHGLDINRRCVMRMDL